MSVSPGAFRANTPPLDAEAMESDLARIPAVSSTRVVIEDDELREVHIVSAGGRSPKLVGRDVQSLLAARWGVDLDHRKVSIVQLEGGEEPTVEEPAKGSAAAIPTSPAAPSVETPRVVGISVSATGDQAEATVTVAAGDREAVGRAGGMPSWSGQRRLAAAAARQGLAELDDRYAAWSVTDASTVRVGADDVVVVSLIRWSAGAEQRVAGAAPVGPSGELRAAVDAVMQALLPA